MHRSILGILTAAAFMIQTSSSAQPDSASIALVDDYAGWGWDSAYVMQNGLVATATVPAIGARIMAYDLADHPSIFVNPAETGRLYTPAPDAPWRNYGGYKVWPAPQSAWNWPPPPMLDMAPYTARIAADTPDSVALFVESPVEQWRAPGLRFERLTTLYRGSSRLRVEQTIVNESDAAQSWSVWDVTQQIVNHSGEEDFDHFRVYFPLNPDSRYARRGVRFTAASSAWLGEVAPGIYGVQFRPENKKLFADSDRGWIAYVDERDGYTYTKTFPVFEGAAYPDEGARVEVWINRDPLYLEVEVLSPVVEITPNGGRTTFVETWGATRLHGPILDVTDAGAVGVRLHRDAPEGPVRGTYGVFHAGTARLVYFDAGGARLAEGPATVVTPLETLAFESSDPLPEQTAWIGLEVRDADARPVGLLDSAQVAALVPTDAERGGPAPKGFGLAPSYPNPAAERATIPFTLAAPGRVSLRVVDSLGRTVATPVDAFRPAGLHTATLDVDTLAPGLYVVHLHTPQGAATHPLTVVR